MTHLLCNSLSATIFLRIDDQRDAYDTKVVIVLVSIESPGGNDKFAADLPHGYSREEGHK
ncbi:hypothetical protein G5O_0756 [Chlamydia psittaci 6BC]|nr:hypothetical protein G5O_0756 [Chlamydia psittaci 6BC]